MDNQKASIKCRVCIRCDLKPTQKCLSLFEKYNESLISDKIKLVANVEIQEGDGLPDRICPDCLLQLETAIGFKTKCETSNKILQSVVQKPSKKFKVFVTPVIKSELKEVEVAFQNIPDDLSTVYSDTENSVEKEPGHAVAEESELLIKKEIRNSTEKVFRRSKAIDLKLTCDDCGGTFKSKCKIAVHWKKVHLPAKLICPHCKRMFKTFKAFNVHAKKKTRSCTVATKVNIEGQGRTRVFYCKECSYKTKRIKDMDAHLTTHTGDRRFQCSDCNKCFTQHSSLQGHRESHHKDYRVDTTCHYCGKHIQGRSKFYKHLRIHKPKSVQCEVCKKVLKSSSNLITHMKRHDGVRGYICDNCPANFFTLGELCNHRKRVHYKSKDFNCDLCEYSTYTAIALKMHKSKHTSDNVPCLLCGMFVENEEKLALHQKRHLEKNYDCPHCDKRFFRRDSCRRHISKKHSCTGMPKLSQPNKQVSEKVIPQNIKQECPVDNQSDDVRTLSPTNYVIVY